MSTADYKTMTTAEIREDFLTPRCCSQTPA